METTMTVKTQRVTILTTPEFKSYLGKEAKDLGVSVSEFIRIRCLKDAPLSTDEQMLSALIEVCNESTQRANDALDRSHAAFENAMKALEEQGGAA